MTIATSVPVFLVLGAPVTLALRSLARRNDGSRGAREWLMSLSRSLPMHVLGHPVVAAAVFVVSMVGFYYTSAFAISLESHTAHVVMTLHVLLSGYLFAESVVGSAPTLRRAPYPLRVLLILVTFGFHALFAVSLISSSTVLAATWFEALERPGVDRCSMTSTSVPPSAG
jgi:cytochrome c oxidase assembly factor CtaG